MLRSGETIQTEEEDEEEFNIRAKALLARVLRLNVLLLPAKLSRVGTENLSHTTATRSTFSSSSSSAVSSMPSVSSSSSRLRSTASTSSSHKLHSSHQQQHSTRGTLTNHREAQQKQQKPRRHLEMFVPQAKRNASEVVFRTLCSSVDFENISKTLEKNHNSNTTKHRYLRRSTS